MAEKRVSRFLSKVGGRPERPSGARPARQLLEGDRAPAMLARVGRPEGGRRVDRVQFADVVEVRGIIGGERSKSRAANLSVGGVFVVTPHVLDPGELVTLALLLPDGELLLDGRVRWATPFGSLHDAVPGMGVEFVRLTMRKRTRLLDLLSRLPEWSKAGPP